MSITPQHIKAWLAEPAAAADLALQIAQSPATPLMRDILRRAAPDLRTIAPTTYTLYREFERTGARAGYERVYFARRSHLTRAVLELVLGDETARDAVHDLVWAICEETTWVLPAHEEQGPGYWDLDPPLVRTAPLGAHTALTRPPDAIDLFAAETGASLAETITLLGDRLAPEVRQRARQEVARRIFAPYLAYGRRHWWYRGALNWNGVCNGAIGLALLRLETEPETLAEGLAQVLEGLDAYIATGFEADGGSIEGVGYWNYGLMYYVAFADLLRERTNGRIDLLGAPRLRAIAGYPLAMSLSPNKYFNPGDANEELVLAPGIVQRLAERTGVHDLRGLIGPVDQLNRTALLTAKLAIMLRNAAWWDARATPFPPVRDAVLPHVGVVKLVGQTPDGTPVVLAAIAGHNDGHHSHTDVGSFVVHLGTTSVLCDPGPGEYTRDYFRQGRYASIFTNSLGHNVPRIGGARQSPGPAFGGSRRFFGTIIDHGERADGKYVVIDMHHAYDLPGLALARRTLRLDPRQGVVLLDDRFAFADAPLLIEEALVTWGEVAIDVAAARITDGGAAATVVIDEPPGVSFQAARFVPERSPDAPTRTLTRLTAALPPGAQQFRARIVPDLASG
jgi:hypothetical protein